MDFLSDFFDFQVTVNGVAFCSAEKPATELKVATELTMDRTIFLFQRIKFAFPFLFNLA